MQTYYLLYSVDGYMDWKKDCPQWSYEPFGAYRYCTKNDAEASIAYLQTQFPDFPKQCTVKRIEYTVSDVS